MTVNCNLLSTLFLAAVICTIVGNLAGVLAWKHRVAEQSGWRWMLDPSYLLRPKLFTRPDHPLRYAAIGLLTLAVVLVGYLLSVIIQMQRSGAESICGFRL